LNTVLVITCDNGRLVTHVHNKDVVKTSSVKTKTIALKTKAKTGTGKTKTKTA